MILFRILEGFYLRNVLILLSLVLQMFKNKGLQERCTALLAANKQNSTGPDIRLRHILTGCFRKEDSSRLKQWRGLTKIFLVILKFS